ncbi:MAG: DnaJ domain-containing protein [Sphingomonadales bacterium]
MIYFVIGAFILIIGLIFLNWLANTKPKSAVKGLAFVLMLLFIGLAVVFMISGRWGLSLPSFMGAWIAFQRFQMAKGMWTSFKGWKNTTQNNNETNKSKGKMTRKEAFEILGLEESASDKDIKHAHKELMFKVHPDKGGTPYFASQLNAAKDILLKY